MPERKFHGVILDGRRPENKTVHPFYDITSELFPKVKDIDVFFQNPPEELADYEVFALRCGDGRTQFVFDHVLKARRKDRQLPYFILELGGTANTLIKGLEKGKRAAFPEELKAVLPPEKYIVRSYQPPKLSLNAGTREQSLYLAYLFAPDHLSTFSQDWFDNHRVPGKAKETYVKAAISALLSFANPKYDPVMPEQILYQAEKGKKEIQIPEKIVSACWTLGVPAFATFKLKEPISENKLRLLVIGGDSRLDTFVKTALALVLGSSFEYGADMAIRAGLVSFRDVNKVVVSPDKSHNPNAVIDGELVRYIDWLSVERAEEELTVLVPKEACSL